MKSVNASTMLLLAALAGAPWGLVHAAGPGEAAGTAITDALPEAVNPASAVAQEPAPVPEAAEGDVEPAPPAAFEPGRRGRVDIGMGFSSLTGGNGDWNDQFMRGHVGLKPGTVFNWELASQRHFGERGTVAAVSLSQELSPLWYANVGMSGGEADFQNKYRFDAGIYRKWGPTQQWVTGLALMKSKSRDGVHRDTGVTASVAYYSTDAWVVEGGIVHNRSNPGSVKGFRGFAAFTQGIEKQHYFTIRADHGKEGYLPTGAIGAADADAQRVGFRSTELTVEWRQWIGANWGYVAGAQFYRNPYYNRKGVTAALFFDF